MRYKKYVIRMLSILLPASLLVGCVSRAQYEKKVTELTNINQQLHDELDRKQKTLRQARANCDAKLAALKDKKSVQAMKLKRAMAILDTLEQDNQQSSLIHKRLTATFAARISTGDMDLVLDRGLLKLRLSGKLLFPFNSNRMNAKGKAVVREIADELKQINQRWQIVGYTDSTGPKLYNRRLAARRALAVFKELTDKGVPSKRLLVSAYGEMMPMVPNHSTTKRALNRRVELILLPRLKKVQVTASICRPNTQPNG